MGFGRQVKDRVWVVATERVIHSRGVSDIDLLEVVPLTMRNRIDGGSGASISEFVDRDGRSVGVPNQLSNEGRTDKPCTTRYEDCKVTQVVG